MSARSKTTKIRKAPPIGHWSDKAACRHAEDPDIFHPPGDGQPGLEAIETCASCPVAAECLDYAVGAIVHGYWAGTTRDERDVLRRRMLRAENAAARKAEAGAGEAEEPDGEAAA